MNSEQSSNPLPPHEIISSAQVEKISISKELTKFENLGLRYSYQIKDQHGNILEDSGDRKCHSFVKQFIQLLSNATFLTTAGSLISVTTTAGAVISTLSSMSLATNAGIGISIYGLQVGTGNTAESINDTSLVTQVAHGTGAGQLQYGAVTYGAPSTTATTTTFRVTRVFTNGSGGNITVAEVGIASGSTSRGFLWARDLTGGVTINNGLAMTLNFDLTTTV